MTRTLLLPLVLLSACMLPVAQSTGPGSTTASGPSSSGSDPELGAPPPASSSSPYSSGSSGSSGSSHAAAPAGPQIASVTIRSACSKTAPVFYGEKPGFSSGTTSSVSSNSVSSKQFRVGDQMWVLDGSGHPLGNVVVGANTREIEISSSCSSLSAR